MDEKKVIEPGAAFYAWSGGDKSKSAAAPELSVVVPMYNECGAAAELIREIYSALHQFDHEIIIVDDASSDATVDAIRKTCADVNSLRVIRHSQNAGQSRALRTGVLAARAPVIITLDGDGQNDPSDIPALYDALKRGGTQSGLAMVCGERRQRQDAPAKKAASKIANNFRRWLLKDGAADTGCGLKAFYREAYLRAPYFDHLHRYLPAMMAREGFDVRFMPVAHRPRTAGRSKYTNIGRLLVAMCDLLGVMWLNSRSRSPGKIREEGDFKGFDRP